MRPFGFSFWKQTSLKGSVLFTPANTTYLSAAASSDWAVGTGDFTVEWWQYQTNNGNENFIWSLGTSNTFAVAVASGGGKINVYMGGSRVANPTVPNTTNAWYHVAISRVSGTLNVYFNGTRVDTFASTTNITDTTSSLLIGTKDGTGGTGDNFPGYMTNFRFIKGTGLYSGTTLTKPTNNLTAVTNTKLLLPFANKENFLKDLSGTNKTITNNNGCVWDALSPY